MSIASRIPESVPALPELPAPALCIDDIAIHLFRCAIATPVQTSFGIMFDRPALFVQVRDVDGAVGWGEVWCNYPTCGAEHRAALIETVIRPLLVGRPFAGPADAFAYLSERTAVLAIQSGEPGPFAQVIAGVDLALWDLCARRAGQPLWRLLGGSSPQMPAYASGINPDQPGRTAAACLQQGYLAFKLKVGFGLARDLANLQTLRDVIGPDLPLMIDANQGWAIDEALAAVDSLAPFGLDWLEEPLRADRPWPEWQALAKASPVPLAAGENLAGGPAFDQAVQSGSLAVLQPDIAKWGGISGCWPVIGRAMRAGLRYCPHYLGGGIGLLASAHLLAASGGGGSLEIDANPNPLRSLIADPAMPIAQGMATLGEQPGLGTEPDLSLLAEACRQASASG